MLCDVDTCWNSFDHRTLLGLCSVPLVCMSVFISVQQGYNNCHFVGEFLFLWGWIFVFQFFFNIALAYVFQDCFSTWGALTSYMNFKKHFLIFIRKIVFEILIGIALSYTSLRRLWLPHQFYIKYLIGLHPHHWGSGWLTVVFPPIWVSSFSMKVLWFIAVSSSSLKLYLWEFLSRNLKYISLELVIFAIACSLEMVSLGSTH